MIRHLLVFSLVALLAGCAGLTSHEALEGQGDTVQWKAHKQQIAQLDGWQINGKIGIRAPQDSGSATLFWLQRQDYYDIRLSGPLGGGAARLTGRPSDILLEVSNRGRFRAESPEALLREQLRLDLPVSNLLWWIRGLPAPESRSRITLDGESHLAQLEQDGWKVEYQRYTEQNGYALPERMKLYGQDLEVTLVIKDWQPRQLGQ
ncbi:lipoprotein localization protein LolB [Ectopseudomonas mendocina]|uniref:Outer-membrane lipoprotein LolB n=1 Tax=Ectopseudomonas mendocina TaxID=300 RepID=A0ABD7RSZ1_ECTME|nr:lipoprotein insertase outer membrane protein LolB [Pseudomonas mendocina]TRO13195.1 lipoprotein localization protein LolB [Pseudomonas mendocina]TRO15326.1 lipoprotein localization protein LolB [Pseudomonas mendocina]